MSDAAEPAGWRLFERYGVELEYMIVGQRDLNVRPIADQLFQRVTGACVGDVEREPISWSNELVAHVVELKTTVPAAALGGLAQGFQSQVVEINGHLAALESRLLPTAMHPWMDPWREARLWPHEYGDVYRAYDRIFDCRGHGWSNLQSAHLNLPFSGDQEFGRLHAAIRLLLPILPALAASSPIVQGQSGGALDSRLEFYRLNSARIPSLTGRVIPEAAFTRADYQQVIFDRIYADIAPHDPQGILQDEFLNSRGAIARFGRGSIEIRLLDVQECPQADLAVCAAVVSVLKLLTAERWSSLAAQQAWNVAPLADLFERCVRDAEQTPIDDGAYLSAFGYQGQRPCTAGELWRRLLEFCEQDEPSREWGPAWDVYRRHGTLARRILHACQGVDWSDAARARGRLETTYATLADCLAEGRLYAPD